MKFPGVSRWFSISCKAVSFPAVQRHLSSISSEKPTGQRTQSFFRMSEISPFSSTIPLFLFLLLLSSSLYVNSQTENDERAILLKLNQHWNYPPPLKSWNSSSKSHCAQTHGGKRGGTAMDNSPTTMAPVLLRQIFTSLFVSAESILCLVEKSKLLQFFRHLLVYIFLSLLPILPSLFPSLNPSPEFYPLKPLKTVDHHSLAKAGDSSLARALSQLLSIMYELPISSRKYDVVRSLAEKVIDENLRQGFEPLRELNRTVLSAAFLRNLERLEAAVTEQERERAAKAGGVGAFDFRLIRAVRALVLKSRPGATRKEVSGCVEKLAAEMLWLAQKLVASGGAEEAVCNWGSASNLAWLAVSAEPRLQCSLVKVSAFLFNQAKEMGHNRDANGAEGKSEQQRQHKLKILMSWLPFLCWASSGIDAPVLTRSERTELEMVLEDIISTLKHEEEQEKVLALWLHHFTCSPSSDWPNLQACYERWCNASRKLLLLQ